MEFLPQEIADRILIEKAQAEQHPHFQKVLQCLRVVRSKEEQKKIQQRLDSGLRGTQAFGDTPEEAQETASHLCACDCCPRHQTERPFLHQCGTRGDSYFPRDYVNEIRIGKPKIEKKFAYVVDEVVGFLLEQDLKFKEGNWTDEDGERYEQGLEVLRQSIRNTLLEMFQKYFDIEMSVRLVDIHMIGYPNLDDEENYTYQVRDIRGFEETVVSFFYKATMDFKSKIASFTYGEEEIDKKVRKHSNFCNCRCRQHLRYLGINRFTMQHSVTHFR